jgi:hypothetical protein
MPPPPILPAQYETVPLEQIDLQNDDFRITTGEDIDALTASIQHAGLISPPVLLQQACGFTVVSGFRRLAACRKLGWQEIIARILEPEVSRLACLRLAISANALERPLNLIETSRAFRKLSVFSTRLEELAETASACGLPANPSIIENIKNLCPISLTVANDLARHPAETAVDFARLFEQLKLSLNKQKEIVRLVGEIAHREDISIRRVLAGHTLQQILSDKELDRGQKGRKIRSFLRQRRFPRIVKAEHNYQAHLKKLKLNPDIRLIPPKDFEGTTYTLNLNFSNLDHLKMLQSTLEKMSRHPSFAKIVEDRND